MKRKHAITILSLIATLYCLSNVFVSVEGETLNGGLIWLYTASIPVIVLLYNNSTFKKSKFWR